MTFDDETLGAYVDGELDAAVLDLVDAMIDGAPLDVQAEAQARKRRWR